MVFAAKAKGLMLDYAKAIHEAIGIESPRLFIGAFALCGFLLFGAVGWVIEKGYRSKASKGPITKSRIVLPDEVDAYFLAGLYAANTSIQGDALISRYLQKWLKISGPVKQVSADGDRIRIITLLPDRNEVGPIYVVLSFERPFHDRISHLIRGAHLSIVGEARHQWCEK